MSKSQLRSSMVLTLALGAIATGCNGGGEGYPQYSANYVLAEDQIDASANFQGVAGPLPFLKDAQKIPRRLRVTHRKSLAMSIMNDYLRFEFNPEPGEGETTYQFDAPLQGMMSPATPGRRDSFGGLEFFRAKDPTLSENCMPWYVYTLSLDGSKTIPSPKTLERAYPLKHEVVTSKDGRQFELSQPPLAKLEMDAGAVGDWQDEMVVNGGEYSLTLVFEKHLYGEFLENCNDDDRKYLQPNETLRLTYRSVDADRAFNKASGTDIRRESSAGFESFDVYSVRQLVGEFINWSNSFLL